MTQSISGISLDLDSAAQLMQDEEKRTFKENVAKEKDRNRERE